MDTLERAQRLIKAANESEDIDGYLASVSEAHALAAIAQAEQLKRIGDALERFVNTHGVTAEVYEAAERGLRLKDENHRLTQRIAQLEGEPNEVGY